MEGKTVLATTAEVAEMTGLPETTISALAHHAKAPTIAVGNGEKLQRFKWIRADVEDFFRALSAEQKRDELLRQQRASRKMPANQRRF